MIIKLYGIKRLLREEQQVEIPVPFETDEEAKLYFVTHIHETPMMRMAPDMFELLYMGTFDTKSGTLIGEKPKVIMKGANLNGNSYKNSVQNGI